MTIAVKHWLLAVVVGLGAAKSGAADLQSIVNGDGRSAESKSRDQYRHPVETLQFFGVTPAMHVLEIWPSKGWYTEILAPFLKDQGHLTIARNRQNDGNLEDPKKIHWARLADKLDQEIAKRPEHFGIVESIEFDPPAMLHLGGINKYDMIISCRNSHVWNEQGYLLDVYRSFFDALKPGGVLAMEEHRSSTLSSISSRAGEGYLDEYYVISVAKEAGFELVSRSEINANPKDTKDYPRGVYALPPTLAMGEQDKAKYLAIGESDRMTLKFRKPANDSK